jgi:hypothetical protein
MSAIANPYGRVMVTGLCGSLLVGGYLWLQQPIRIIPIDAQTTLEIPDAQITLHPQLPKVRSLAHSFQPIWIITPTEVEVLAPGYPKQTARLILVPGYHYYLSIAGSRSALENRSQHKIKHSG